MKVSRCPRGAGIECLSNHSPALARFLPDGSPDPGFGGDGELEPSALSHTGDWTGVLIEDIATDEDAIVLVGSAAGARLWVGRLLADGSPDPGFGGGDGAVTYNSFGNSPNEQSEADSVAILPDRRIVVVGRAETYPADDPTFVALRLLTDGTFDPSFSGDGWLTEAVGGLGVYDTNGLAIGSDGRMVTAVTGFGSPWEIFVYANDGTRESSFADDGALTIAVDLYQDSTSLALDPENRILLGGKIGEGAPPELLRLTATGVADPTFGGDGAVPIVFPSPSGSNRGGTSFNLAVDEASRPVVGYGIGATVARFTSNGSLDPDFSVDGASTVFSRKRSAIVADLALSSSKIVLAGSAGRNTLTQRGMVSQRRLEAGPLDTDGDAMTDQVDECPYVYGDCPRLKRRLSRLRYFPRRKHPAVIVEVRSTDPDCDEAAIKILRKKRGRDAVVLRRPRTERVFADTELRPGRYYAQATVDHFDFGFCPRVRSDTLRVRR
jgi:uncharacterized delta-60 repeat protein